MTTAEAPSGSGGTAASAELPEAPARIRRSSAPGPLTRPEQHLSGPRRRLDRLSTVRPGTVVVVLEEDAAPQVKSPGELLIPSWRPSRGGRDAVVVTTESVELDVTVQDLLTLDGEDLASVDLVVRVRLHRPSLLSIVGQYGDELGARLIESAGHSIESSVRAAVGMNRAADLRRQSLATVLNEQWLPKSFAQGGLILDEFTIRAFRWPNEPALADEDGSGIPDLPDPMVRAPVTEPLLRLGTLGRDDRHARHRSGSEALRLVHLPLTVSAAVFWLFFMAYWVPELQSLPAAHILLEQFAPLASKELTSQTRPLVPSQAGHLGLPAAFLLVVSPLIPPLARHRWWLARLALWPLTYLAAVSAVITLIGVLVRGQLAVNLLGVLLLVVWVLGAVLVTWRSLWVDIDTLPRRPARVGWLVAVFAVFNPLPVALGRRLFAPDLRSAAVSVVENDLMLRWAALLTPATALVYLGGLLVAVVAWMTYLLWPPRLTDRRRAPTIALVLALAGLLVVGPQAAAAGDRRAAAVGSASPRDEVGFTCGSWVHQPAGEPAQTLVVSGLSCKRITAFLGYHEISTRLTTDSLSPVKAGTLLGRRIEGRVVGAAYGDVVILATTDRMDNDATALVGVGTSNATEVWRYRCPVSKSMTLRFTGSSDQDDSTAGRLTLRGERPAVVVDCGAGTVRLDPRTGRAT